MMGIPEGSAPGWVLRSSCPAHSLTRTRRSMASINHQVCPTSRGSKQVGKWAGGQQWVRQDSREGSQKRDRPEH